MALYIINLYAKEAQLGYNSRITARHEIEEEHLEEVSNMHMLVHFKDMLSSIILHTNFYSTVSCCSRNFSEIGHRLHLTPKTEKSAETTLLMCGNLKTHALLPQGTVWGYSVASIPRVLKQPLIKWPI